MLLGMHVSAAGELINAPLNATKIGCEVFQFFSRPPQGGVAKPITAKDAEKFQLTCKKNGLKECYIHAPYFINLASTNNRIRYGSISVLREELKRGSLLGVKYLMTHLGSAKDLGEEKGIDKVIEGLKKILDGYQGSCDFLLEISAGSGAIIGDSFEEMGQILKALKHHHLGICFDTQHAFASGYDLRDEKAVNETLKVFDRQIGLRHLKLIHCNDSMVELGTHIDRHEHIGKGKIGLAGFIALVQHPKLKNINMILETPGEIERIKDLQLLKQLRTNKS